MAAASWKKRHFPAKPPSFPVAYARETVKRSCGNMHSVRKGGNMHLTPATHLGRRIVHPACQHEIAHLNANSLLHALSCQGEVLCMSDLKSTGPFPCKRSKIRLVACSYEGTTQSQLSLRMQWHLITIIMTCAPQSSRHALRMRSHDKWSTSRTARVAGEAM